VASRKTASSGAGGHRTVLTVGSEVSLWQPLLVQWVRMMRRSHPDIVLRVRLGLNALATGNWRASACEGSYELPSRRCKGNSRIRQELFGGADVSACRCWPHQRHGRWSNLQTQSADLECHLGGRRETGAERQEELFSFGSPVRYQHPSVRAVVSFDVPCGYAFEVDLDDCRR
jgi:DNA-binding transcriptional LysR family regulator